MIRGVSSTRREMLGQLGAASASTLLWALGCGPAARPTARLPTVLGEEVRAWLRDAVARLAAVDPGAHALAVTHERTAAAIDVVGAGLAQMRRDGAVLRVRGADGAWREHVTDVLTAAGIDEAVRRLGGAARATPRGFPAAPVATPAPAPVDEALLRDRAAALLRDDARGASRIVYAAGLVEVDDVTRWSIAATHDREERRRRVRHRATRAAWNGTRPVIAEAARGWSGDLRRAGLDAARLRATSEEALTLVTPGAFAAGVYEVELAPTVVAALIEATVAGLLTTAALRHPALARRFAAGAALAAPLLTLTDDPTAADSYGAIGFDDEGAAAQPVTLIEGGLLAGRLDAAAGRARRPGHLGPLAPGATHLVLAPGTSGVVGARDGWRLEGRAHAAIAPGTTRVVIAVARAREVRAGSLTGRVFADVELVGEVDALLGAVSAVGAEVETLVRRDEDAGGALWRSLAVPALVTRGALRARRRAA